MIKEKKKNEIVYRRESNTSIGIISQTMDYM